MKLLAWFVSRSEWVMDRYRGTRGILGRAVVIADLAWLEAIVETTHRQAWLEALAKHERRHGRES